MTTRVTAPSTRKVRRDVAGGKRADGRRREKRVRRPDPRRIHVEATESSLTSTAGLAPFGAFVRDLGVDRRLCAFNRLKRERSVVYPMASQMRLLLDAFAVGEERVFHLESLAADPLFVRLAGGVVPSLDTVYRDLCRFDDEALGDLGALMVEHGLAPARGRRETLLHVDIDTTVEPLFGEQQGALPGPNPRYHGRPSYHPMLARVAETDTVVGAVLRPGDTSVGSEDVPWIEDMLDGVRQAVGPNTALYVRMDAAGECAAILDAITDKKAFFVVKARMTRDLMGAASLVSRWRTTDWDADGKPRQQVAELDFQRATWTKHRYRVIAVRTLERPSGKEIFLWDDLAYSVQVYVTNEWAEAPEDVARRYNKRAGIEPLIGELKHGWGIGKVPSKVFAANHAMLLLKLLAYNLMRRFVLGMFPELTPWRAAWLRRALLLVPGRLVRSGRRWTVRVPQRSMLSRWIN